MSLGFTKEWYEGERKNIHHARTVVVDSKPSTVDAEPGWNSVQSRRTQHRITYEDPPRWEQQEREQQVAVQYHGYAAHIRWRTKIVQTRSDSPATDAAHSSSVFLQEQWEDEIELDFSQYFRGLGDAHSVFPDPSHHSEPQPTLPSTFRPPLGPAPPAPALQPSAHQHPLQLEHHPPRQQQHSREHHPPGHYQYHHYNPLWPADRITYAPAPPPIEPARRITYATAPPPTHRNSHTPRVLGPFMEESDDDALFVGGPPPFPRGNGVRPPTNGARVPEDAYTDMAAPPAQQAPQRKRGRRGKGGRAAATPQVDVGDDDIYYA
ncbi:uncharacterized protein MYCFIDRAFT_200991 [Pseudocercospora fijiensis CIRAD86]|uniref:Uncharacterized protein n=1 Tax=Pseudocercospora fijiensis (strain CIRAD86) TaxID=383855 RepID=M2ZCI1_PSEFD|nr:uncharacterized protein MYCFIDRAFT_200991 [Pseudocercospora fijiensis CIRAD86]EME76809.1 hypothetical protein MYCFIDRAFT_200991 [Pseudocercospora fijiensis CIRAD86]